MIQRVDGFHLVTSARKHATNRVGEPTHGPAPNVRRSSPERVVRFRGARRGQARPSVCSTATNAYRARAVTP
jgi:hypothetical protein